MSLKADQGYQTQYLSGGYIIMERVFLRKSQHYLVFSSPQTCKDLPTSTSQKHFVNVFQQLHKV